MKLRMAENSLFAILLRSRWWVSLAVGAAAVTLALVVAPREYAVYAAFGAMPFFVIAAIAAWKQLQAPSPARLARTLEAVQAMSWPQWIEAVGQGFERDGFQVERLTGGGADLLVTRSGRRSLVACRRWKVARVGVEPLRELSEAAAARDVDHSIYLAIGELTEQARRFAASHRIKGMQLPEIAQVLPQAGVAKRRDVPAR